MIYGEANKAFYGTLNASLLFLKDLTGTLGEWKFGNNNDGFILNPYDTCVANCMINGKIVYYPMARGRLEDQSRKSRGGD